MVLQIKVNEVDKPLARLTITKRKKSQIPEIKWGLNIFSKAIKKII